MGTKLNKAQIETIELLGSRESIDPKLFGLIVSLVAARNEATANHDSMVMANAFLRQRPDLPVDRIPAYQELVKAREELKALKETQKTRTIYCCPENMGDGTSCVRFFESKECIDLLVDWNPGDWNNEYNDSFEVTGTITGIEIETLTDVKAKIERGY